MEPGYAIRELSSEEFSPLYEKYREEVFADDHSYNKWSLLCEDELDKKNILSKNMGTPFRLFLGVFDVSNNFVGWSWGFQENSTTYYMCNSGVLADHRRKGIYQSLLNYNIDILSEMGFQIIYSRHCVTNNFVIIPKLKSGFILSKMELSDNFGVLVHLHYYTNKTRKKIMDYRSGQLKPDEEIKKVFIL